MDQPRIWWWFGDVPSDTTAAPNLIYSALIELFGSDGSLPGMLRVSLCNGSIAWTVSVSANGLRTPDGDSLCDAFTTLRDAFDAHDSETAVISALPGSTDGGTHLNVCRVVSVLLRNVPAGTCGPTRILQVRNAARNRLAQDIALAVELADKDREDVSDFTKRAMSYVEQVHNTLEVERGELESVEHDHLGMERALEAEVLRRRKIDNMMGQRFQKILKAKLDYWEGESRNDMVE